MNDVESAVAQLEEQDTEGLAEELRRLEQGLRQDLVAVCDDTMPL